MFGRRAGEPDIADAVAAAYPGAGQDVLAELLAVPDRPRRSGVAEWVDDQVLRAAARRCAADAGLADAPYPPDGDEALRVYLPVELADADVAAVGAHHWARARDDAWIDHGDVLPGDRELWWAEQLPVEPLVASWREQR